MENYQDKSLDTSTLLNEEDIDMISKISQIKRDITTYFDMDLFIMWGRGYQDIYFLTSIRNLCMSVVSFLLTRAASTFAVKASRSV